MNKKLKGIIISGATGVGKTDLSIKLAKRLNADIISADASQVYKFLDIGTAKVTEDEMQGIKHYMIDVVEPDEDYSVGDFEVEVNKILHEKEENAENIILVGGTGLYIRAITDGFSDLPTKDEKIRKDLEKKSLEELQEILKALDLQAYNEIDLNNKLRLVRAIEVCKITGGKFSELRVKNIKKNNYNFLKVFLTRNREELYERINKRVDIMIQKGLVEEAKKVYNNYEDSLYKISAIGYKELFNYFDGKVSLEEAIEDIKRESRRYAKRQMTWFRKEKDYLIYNLSEISEKEIIEDILRNYDNFS
ncbi:tRNA (adenosine(37)-N6)-dimethylallyltransferase MiaA [Leptotrichia sp. oral taxon 221]|jgi:tRNA dimethylallyltransferase|uniref:tRNA (adenosine(37)-N6)-dimethylallyltransferase MiaA n=1 Tax=Leptotrichia sp. oral taxon 221 TaxID=712362 RepID=UPI001B8D70B4|nr:tRNA (adenosine(37)-N6)-dimethylallyltransferase MiaA [Leptotrichia sp. oral taxon 221]QUB96735.1 tRNA (adenosine(37)-N6)-dimethylallyltransferase MiaA [Leptotrichia sp. oral taxon 221]